MDVQRKQLWELDSKEVIATLPAGFYTTASMVKPYAKLKVDEGMVVWFLVLQGAMVGFVWGVLGWVCWRGRGLLSVGALSFVVFDAAVMVVSTVGEVEATAGERVSDGVTAVAPAGHLSSRSNPLYLEAGYSLEEEQVVRASSPGLL